MTPEHTHPTVDITLHAERAVLGGILQDPATLGDAAMLTTEDFLDPEHGFTFGAILATEGPLDEITVGHTLREQGRSVPIVKLVQLTEAVPTAANVAHYADIVKQASMLRQAQAIGNNLGKERKGTAGSLIENATTKLLQLIGNVDRGCRDLDMVGDEFNTEQRQRWDGRKDFVPTGLWGLDDQLGGGLYKRSLVVLGARPSVGKTALGVDIALRNAREKRRVLFYSLEMPAVDLMGRMVSWVSGVSMEQLLSGKGEEAIQHKYKAAMKELRTLPVTINDSKGLTAIQIRASARAYRARHPVDLIIVDYLQRVRPSDPKAIREAQVAEVSDAMKTLAEDCNCPVLCLAQLNRASAKGDGPPDLSDLRDSGRIEQDADVALLLWRERETNERIIEVAKARNGRSGASLDVGFNAATGVFTYQGARKKSAPA